MADLILTAEQAQVLFAADNQVTLRDPNGHIVGVVNPPPIGFTEEDLRDALQRRKAGKTCYSTAEVLRHLSELERLATHSGLSHEMLVQLSGAAAKLSSLDASARLRAAEDIAGKFGVKVGDIDALVPVPWSRNR